MARPERSLAAAHKGGCGLAVNSSYPVYTFALRRLLGFFGRLVRARISWVARAIRRFADKILVYSHQPVMTAFERIIFGLLVRFRASI